MFQSYPYRRAEGVKGEFCHISQNVKKKDYLLDSQKENGRGLTALTRT